MSYPRTSSPALISVEMIVHRNASFTSAPSRILRLLRSPRLQICLPALASLRSANLNASPARLTICTYYFAMCMLGKQIPILWQEVDELYLFASDGVYCMERSDTNIYFSACLPALVDTEPTQQVPPRLISSSAHTYLILTTSPDQCRWNRRHKSRLPNLCRESLEAQGNAQNVSRLHLCGRFKVLIFFKSAP